MSTPYLGQLMLASFNFPPKGWALCNGQTMAINQYQALFSLLGTTFGGNGIQTFQLPNLQGRTPVGVGSNIAWGEMGGEDTHTLLVPEVPAHTHQLMVDSAGTAINKPNGAMLAGNSAAFFSSATSLAAMNAATLPPAGGSQAHENRQPFLVMTWCIALSGIFPSRS